MVNILIILFAFVFIPILGIPDKYDLYLYLIVIGLLCFESLRLWRTREIFRKRVLFLRSEIKKIIKSFFKEEEIIVEEEVQDNANIIEEKDGAHDKSHSLDHSKDTVEPSEDDKKEDL